MAQAKLNFDGVSGPKKTIATPAAQKPSTSAHTGANTGGGYVRGYTRRTRGLFEPNSKIPFRISRSKLENFVRCPRCFYLDVRLGIKQPDSYPLTLNTAVDHLLKKEFDTHRAKGERHPLMKAYQVDAIPFSHPDLDQWRENFTGVQFLYKPTNFLIFGAVDDVWVNPTKELIVVDYKATAKESGVSIDADWQDGYKRQMEIYQWLLRQNGFAVSDTGYFVYANGRKDREAFDGKLEFDVTLIPYTGKADWIEDVVQKAHALLSQDKIPASASNCDFCSYRKIAAEIESR